MSAKRTVTYTNVFLREWNRTKQHDRIHFSAAAAAARLLSFPTRNNAEVQNTDTSLAGSSQTTLKYANELGEVIV